MDGKFLLLLLTASATAFAGTWMVMRPKPVEHRAAEFAAVDKHGKVLKFANCDEVRAAGMAPLWAGKPGYTRELDVDGLGMACPPR